MTAETLELATHHAAETESRGRLHPAVVDALVADGTFKLWVPTDYNGAGTTLAGGLDAMRALGKADGATGWCVMIANTTALLAARLDATVAHQIFGPDGAVCGGFAAPVGTATLHESNVTISGRWAWGSGSSHATTMGAGVRIVDREGAPAQLPGGGQVGFAFVPEGVELLDTWQVSGLQGTASTDYVIDDAVVPVDHVVAMDQRRLVVDETLYRFSTFGALALGVAMVMIGMAERAIEELAALAGKVPQGSSRSLAERAPVQLDLARAEAEARSARAFVDQQVGTAWEQVGGSGRMDDEQRVALRLAASHAATAAVSAVDRCYAAAGGAAAYQSSPLQRVFRDVHVASQHAMVAPRVFEPLGRHRFGLPTDLASL